MSRAKGLRARQPTSQFAKSLTARPNRDQVSRVMGTRCSLVTGACGVSPHSSCHDDAHAMCASVPRQRDARRPVAGFDGSSVEIDGHDRGRTSPRVLHLDLVDGAGAGTVGDAIAGPRAGRAGTQDDRVSVLYPEAEDRLERDTIEPSRGARVPAPAAAALVRRLTVDVGGDHIRLELV